MKVLVAVDNSDASKKAVSFASRLILGEKSDSASVTLFHVVESLPEFIVARSTAGGAFATVAQEWSDINLKIGEQLLEAQKQTLVAAGVPAARIHTTCRQKESLPESSRVVAALAIIEEMKSGNYDTIVIGRRGTNALISSFLGGVAEKVAREAFGRTLCIVDA